MAEKRSRDFFVALDHDWYFCSVCDKPCRFTKNLSRHLRNPNHQEQAQLAREAGVTSFYPVPNEVTPTVCRYVAPLKPAETESSPPAEALELPDLPNSPNPINEPEVDDTSDSEHGEAPKLVDLVTSQCPYLPSDDEDETILHWEVDDSPTDGSLRVHPDIDDTDNFINAVRPFVLPKLCAYP